ncbi:hypothetical protein Trydic_g9057 [Trypoxylus dichotomus]
MILSANLAVSGSTKMHQHQQQPKKQRAINDVNATARGRTDRWEIVATVGDKERRREGNLLAPADVNASIDLKLRATDGELLPFKYVNANSCSRKSSQRR